MPDLKELACEILPTLRLENWTIEIGYCRYYELEKENREAEVSFEISNRSAVILIVHPQDRDPLTVIDIADSLWHECLHLVLAPLECYFPKSDPYHLAETTLEQIVWDLSNAFGLLTHEKAQENPKCHIRKVSRKTSEPTLPGDPVGCGQW